MKPWKNINPSGKDLFGYKARKPTHTSLREKTLLELLTGEYAVVVGGDTPLRDSQDVVGFPVPFLLSLLFISRCLAILDSVPFHRMNPFSFRVKKFLVSSLLEAK